MSGWPLVPLGELAKLDRAAVGPREIQSGTSYVGLENIEGGGTLVGVRAVDAGELASNKFAFTPRHLLYGKLRPYLAKIARPDFKGICSTDILPLLPGQEVDRDYLWHFLLTPDMVSHASSLSAGANLPRLSPAALLQFRVPLPSLPEQRRIAAILDKADELRAKRRTALAQLDTLTRSIFHDMFGDPVANVRGWARRRFRDLISAPLRNGLSPSAQGTVPAKVLTLSAITGRSFDPSAWKTSTFLTVPPIDQSVRRDDFLICRGNGNLNMVGRGQLVPTSLPDTTFPDTMIAARASTEVVHPAYLQHIWNSGVVRMQIESLARTTNGTFKVNQDILQNIELPLPPRTLQATFGERIAELSRLRAGQNAAKGFLDTLFNSLQHRAFRGEL